MFGKVSAETESAWIAIVALLQLCERPGVIGIRLVDGKYTASRRAVVRLTQVPKPTLLSLMTFS